MVFGAQILTFDFVSLFVWKQETRAEVYLKAKREELITAADNAGSKHKRKNPEKSQPQ